MPKQVAAHSETLNKRCGKRNSPKKLRRITTYKSLYAFLLNIIEVHQPPMIHNAGVIKFVRKFCWDVLNWGCQPQHAIYYMHDLIREIEEDQSSDECSQALISYFDNLLVLARRGEKPSVLKACKLLIKEMNMEEYIYVDVWRDGKRVLKGTKKLEQEFHVRLDIRNRKRTSAHRTAAAPQSQNEHAEQAQPQKLAGAEVDKLADRVPRSTSPSSAESNTPA